MDLDLEKMNMQIHSLPAMVMLECQLPDGIVDDLNEYLDDYREKPEKKSFFKNNRIPSSRRVGFRIPFNPPIDSQ